MPEADYTPTTSTPDPFHPVTTDADRFAAWRDAIRRERRADDRADVRETPTVVLLADLADHRADLARRLPPLWWPVAASRAGRIRAVLRERGEDVR